MSTRLIALGSRAAIRGHEPSVTPLPTLAEANFNPGMLRRTTPTGALTEPPERIDHFALERRARQLRQEFIVACVRRLKTALARRFAARGPRVAAHSR